MHASRWYLILLLLIAILAASSQVMSAVAVGLELPRTQDLRPADGAWTFGQHEHPLQATATTTATLALPELSGEWSITRSWYRRCPGCGSSVTLTSRWIIQQSGAEVRMEQGPRGLIFRDGAGVARLDLEGLEQAGPSTLRFQYASLVVAEDGSGFAGDFNGSERIANPCGASPPVVTCFVSNGWIRATRVDSGGPTSVPVPSATNMPSSTPVLATPTVAETSLPTVSPTSAASVTPRPSVTPSATSAPSQTPVPPTLRRCYLPWAKGG